MSKPPYPCPCCGYLVFAQPPGSYSVCPICDWEDDAFQLRYPDQAGGANGPSLMQAQRHFAKIGVSDPHCRGRERVPGPADRRDPAWRPVDLWRDILAHADAGDTPAPWPEDPARLYYWRANF
jgi:hypothetical protein